MLHLRVTFTEGTHVRVINIRPQPVGFVPVERACAKLDVFFRDMVSFLDLSCGYCFFGHSSYGYIFFTNYRLTSHPIGLAFIS
jgi:hypothetical protein